jgi:hypothetical protein
VSSPIRTRSPYGPGTFVPLSTLTAAWEDATVRTAQAEETGRRVDVEDYWTELALGTRIAREVTSGRWVVVARLLRAGEITGWESVAEALWTTAPAARDGFRTWVAQQRSLFAETGVGLSAADADELNALAEAVTW